MTKACKKLLAEEMAKWDIQLARMEKNIQEMKQGDKERNHRLDQIENDLREIEHNPNIRIKLLKQSCESLISRIEKLENENKEIMQIMLKANLL